MGGAVAFASQALDDSGQGPPSATAPPPPAITLLAPPAAITRGASTDLVAIRPQGLRADQRYAVRVYVNGAQVRERELPASETFELQGVPLRQGENVIAATLVGDGGEGARSAEVTVVRDDKAPAIDVTQPGPRERVFGDSALLRGRTEAGATLSITRAGSGEEMDATVHEDGRFSAALELRPGSNAFVLRSADAAGNRASARITILRGESAARLTLDIRPESVSTTELPATVTISATLRDEVGRLVDGAEVTFGVSPPNDSTSTYRVTTVDGRASWQGITLTSADSSGVWLVTVSATLPSGVELRQNGEFSLE